MTINPCRCCGEVPEITVESEYYELACDVYACNNPDVVAANYLTDTIRMWNKLNPKEEDHNDSMEQTVEKVP